MMACNCNNGSRYSQYGNYIINGLEVIGSVRMYHYCARKVEVHALCIRLRMIHIGLQVSDTQPLVQTLHHFSRELSASICHNGGRHGNSGDYLIKEYCSHSLSSLMVQGSNQR